MFHVIFEMHIKSSGFYLFIFTYLVIYYFLGVGVCWGEGNGGCGRLGAVGEIYLNISFLY